MPKCTRPPYIDLNKDLIDYFEIRDVMKVPYFNNVIVATDYNYGLLFWRYKCGIPFSLNPFSFC